MRALSIITLVAAVAFVVWYVNTRRSVTIGSVVANGSMMKIPCASMGDSMARLALVDSSDEVLLSDTYTLNNGSNSLLIEAGVDASGDSYLLIGMNAFSRILKKEVNFSGSESRLFANDHFITSSPRQVDFVCSEIADVILGGKEYSIWLVISSIQDILMPEAYSLGKKRWLEVMKKRGPQ